MSDIQRKSSDARIAALEQEVTLLKRTMASREAKYADEPDYQSETLRLLSKHLYEDTLRSENFRRRFGIEPIHMWLSGAVGLGILLGLLPLILERLL